MRRLLNQAGVDRDRILLSSFRSVDWHSLTLKGERHRISLRISAPDANIVAGRLLDDLEEAEIPIPGHALANTSVQRQATSADGRIILDIEALTISD